MAEVEGIEPSSSSVFGFGVRHTAVVLYFLVLTQGFEPQSLAYKVSTLSLS